MAVLICTVRPCRGRVATNAYRCILKAAAHSLFCMRPRTCQPPACVHWGGAHTIHCLTPVPFRVASDKVCTPLVPSRLLADASTPSAFASLSSHPPTENINAPTRVSPSSYHTSFTPPSNAVTSLRPQRVSPAHWVTYVLSQPSIDQTATPPIALSSHCFCQEGVMHVCGPEGSR